MADNKFEAIERDHRRVWNTFVRIATYATAGLVVILALMAFAFIR